MDGITVLKTYEEVAYTTWGWTWAGFFVGLIVLIGLALGLYFMIKDKDFSGLAGCLIIFVFGGMISLIMFNSATEIYEPRQDVYIHGIVNMDEFNERYRVIEQDGLIYTITDKVSK